MSQGIDNGRESGGYWDAVALLIATFELNKYFFVPRIPYLYQQLSNEVRYCRRMLHAGKQSLARSQLQQDLFRLFGVRVYVPVDRQLSVLAGVIHHVLIAGIGIHGHAVERGGLQLLVSEVFRRAQPAVSGNEDLLALDGRLAELSVWFPESMCLLELRYFARLGLRDIAVELGVEVLAIKRDIRLAKDWLIAGLH